MNALLFPGQGSQSVKMGNEFFQSFDIVKEIFKKSDQILNYPISKIILDGPEEKLQLTQNAQPAILMVSFSIFKVFKNEFGYDFKNFKCFAGHSLGEYSALVCAGSIEFDDAIYLLHERGKAMQAAVPIGEGKMIAVLGAEIELVKKLINETNFAEGVCEIANDNANGQVIVSGDKESIKIFENILKEQKIKAIPLKVSAPFHCSMMKPAAEIMKEKIEKTKFNNPSFQIINNVNAEAVNKSEVIKDLLVKQIYSPVKWRESIININRLGVKNFVELGPGKALTGMVKRTVKDVNCYTINSVSDIKNVQNELKE